MTSYTLHDFAGNGCEIGFKMGRSMGDRYEALIQQYLQMVDRVCRLDHARMEREASEWLHKLPEDYLVEIESLSFGTGVKIERIAVFLYYQKCTGGGCTSFLKLLRGNVWVGCNHEDYGPRLWRHIQTIRKEGMIPVVLFGRDGDLFSGTGFNAHKLWLHCGNVPAWDTPQAVEKGIPPFVFVRMALERCHTLADVENLLRNTLRDGGMNLFAVDGKSNDFQVYECTCRDFVKRTRIRDFMAGADHYAATRMPEGFSAPEQSVRRQARMEALLESKPIFHPLSDFTTILADPGIERIDGIAGTVSSNLSCPALNRHYYACNGFPAASRAVFEEVELHNHLELQNLDV